MPARWCSSAAAQRIRCPRRGSSAQILEQLHTQLDEGPAAFSLLCRLAQESHTQVIQVAKDLLKSHPGASGP